MARPRLRAACGNMVARAAAEACRRELAFAGNVPVLAAAVAGFGLGALARVMPRLATAIAGVLLGAIVRHVSGLATSVTAHVCCIVLTATLASCCFDDGRAPGCSDTNGREGDARDGGKSGAGLLHEASGGHGEFELDW